MGKKAETAKESKPAKPAKAVTKPPKDELEVDEPESIVMPDLPGTGKKHASVKSEPEDDYDVEPNSGDEIEEALKEANGEPKPEENAEKEGENTDESLQEELEASGAVGNGEEAPAEEEKKERAVLVPVSIRLGRDELVSWFKTHDSLESYVIFTTAGSNFVEIVGFDAPHRLSVLTKLSNLETEAIRKDVTQTGFIPLSNKKETISRHINVVGGKTIDIAFDGKDITIKSGEEESTFTPEADQVDEAIEMKRLFNSKIDGDKIEALGVTYTNYLVFDKKFGDILGRWEKYNRDYLAFVIDGSKVRGRFVSDMADVNGKGGATVIVEPKKVSVNGQYTIAFTGISVSSLKKTLADDDELTVFFFSDDYPYIVATKSGKTMMVIASTIEDKKEK